jgi:hypothetical protein
MTKQRWLIVGFGIIWLTAAVLYVPGVLDAFGSANWPATEGRILSTAADSRTTKRSVTYELELGYSYAVDGRPYTGDRIDFVDGVLARSREELAREQRRHGLVEGATVVVHYDPADPARSVLWPGFDPRRGGILGILVVGMPLLSALCLVGRWRGPRRRARIEQAATPLRVEHADWRAI